MPCHFCFLIVACFLSFSFLYSQQLSRVDFEISSEYLTPDNDGWNDEVIFRIVLHQNTRIAVKSWELLVYNRKNRLVFRHVPGERELAYKKEFFVVWNGKDGGVIVEHGPYDAVLHVEYSYGGIKKQYVHTIQVLQENISVPEVIARQPYLVLSWDPVTKKFTPPVSNASFLLRLPGTNELPSLKIRSYLLDPKKEVKEEAELAVSKEMYINWNGYAGKSLADFSSYFYVMHTVSKEKKIKEVVVSGVTVLPFEVENMIFPLPNVINERGYGYHQEVYREMELYAITSRKEPVVFRDSAGDRFYQVYCLKTGFFRTGWEFRQEGYSEISRNGVKKILSAIPANQHCQILFFSENHALKEYDQLFSKKVLAVLPVFVDTEKPQVKVEIRNPKVRPDFFYQDFAQILTIQAQDNTFLKKVSVNLFLEYGDDHYLLKRWDIHPYYDPQKKYYEAKVFWYGDTLSGITVESLENLKFVIEVTDIAGNRTVEEKTFFTDLYFREEQENYKAVIPLSNLFAKTDRLEDLKKHFPQILPVIAQEFSTSKKKYMYIKVHAERNGNDEENFSFTERIGKLFYEGITQYVSKDSVFYRGWGELRPYFPKQYVLSSYRDFRLEIEFSDRLADEEKDIY